MEKTDGTMKAAVVDHPCDPADHPCKIESKIRYQQVDIPEPKPGEVLIKMLAVDVCRNDICCIAGEWAEATKFPLVPGHEGVGVIEKLGENVQHLHVGDRVGTAWMHCACLACKYCGAGRENACPCHKHYGTDSPGTLAQYAVAQANFLVPIPDNLSDDEAATVTSAGLIAYQAVKESKIWAGQYLAVVGAAGGIGHMVCQYGKAMGARVIAIDVGEEKKAFCESLGVELAISCRQNGHADSIDTVKQVVNYTGGGAHAVVGCATTPDVFKCAVQMTRRCGTAICLGFTPGDVQVPLVDLVMRNLTLRGFIVGNRQDLREALDFAARGLVKCKIDHTIGLEELNEALKQVAQNAVDGRIVVKF